MKTLKTLLFSGLLMLPAIGWGSLGETQEIGNSLNIINIPAIFTTSSYISIFEWGCPVAEVVEAHSGAEALQKIGQECMDEARNAASKKPGVFDVIQVSIIVPDIHISESKDGFYLKGTFFLETLVLKQSNRP